MSDDAPTERGAPPWQEEPTGRSEPSSREVSVRALLTPEQTLLAQEARRMRVFVALVVALSLLVPVVLPLLRVPPAMKWLVAASAVLVMPFAFRLAWRLRRIEGYTSRDALTFGFVCLVPGYAGMYLFGPLSPACAVIALGVYLFAPGQQRRAALGLFSATALANAALSLSVTSGLLPDWSLVKTTQVAPGLQLVVLALAELVLLLSFIIGRTTRATTLYAIEERDRALRAVAQRSQILKEAHEELQRALQGGGLGRYTDETFGNYRLGEVVGRGGMGEVYEAYDIRTEERCAVKILHHHVQGEGVSRRRLAREAEAAMRLDSPHVCRVLAIDEHRSIPFLAMEFLEGEDLSEELRHRRRLALSEVVLLVHEVAIALEQARSAGVVHRDIKPRNLCHVREADGRKIWKVLDFGISKLAESSGTLTQGQLVGTPSYMSPEQAVGAPVDHRSDVYSLAVVAYRALVGRPAFVGDSMPDVLFQVLHSIPTPPSESVRTKPDVDCFFAIAMAKDPNDRFQTAPEMAVAFARAARGALSDATRRRGLELGGPRAVRPAAVA
jgi:eukaryotic-like serine/threonine-protein kinase